MKRRNFFKALAAVAVIPILPEPKPKYVFYTPDTILGGSGWRYGQYTVGMWSPKGSITYPYADGLYGDLANKEIKHFNIPRHGVNSREYIDRYI